MSDHNETPKQLGVRGTGEKFARFIWASIQRLTTMTVRELAAEAKTPTTLAVVPIATDRECQMYRGEEPSPCENTAQYIYVYNQYVDNSQQGPDNCLACEECIPVES